MFLKVDLHLLHYLSFATNILVFTPCYTLNMSNKALLLMLTQKSKCLFNLKTGKPNEESPAPPSGCIMMAAQFLLIPLLLLALLILLMWKKGTTKHSSLFQCLFSQFSLVPSANTLFDTLTFVFTGTFRRLK